MRRTVALIALAASVVAFGPMSPSAALAQRRHPPAGGGRGEPRPEPRAQPRPPVPSVVHRGGFVFIGGYYYDPFFGPYPWWQRRTYPYPYYPMYDNRATLRVLDAPDDAAVYVDGFYAGIVDDFNGYFQGLPLPPGGHEVVLYLEGYRTVHRRVHLAANSIFKLHEPMERLLPGEISEPPTLAPPLPRPPQGTYLPPRTAPPVVLPPAVRAPEAGADFGTLTLRVQPPAAEVWIDGERWTSSDGGRFDVQLPPGRHRIEVVADGYRGYVGDIQVSDGMTIPLNVTLTRERP